MLLIFACVFAFAAARPASYDQRQDGELNFRADVNNVLFVIALPQKVPSSLLDVLLMGEKGNVRKATLQERSDTHVMEAFVEPNTPYQVEIGRFKERQADSDGAKIEVVIAGRPNLDPDHDEEAEPDEIKLLGATEQCGPDRERDPVTLTCKSIQAEPQTSEVSSEKKDEQVVPQPQPTQPTPEVISS